MFAKKRALSPSSMAQKLAEQETNRHNRRTIEETSLSNRVSAGGPSTRMPARSHPLTPSITENEDLDIFDTPSRDPTSSRTRSHSATEPRTPRQRIQKSRRLEQTLSARRASRSRDGRSAGASTTVSRSSRARSELDPFQPAPVGSSAGRPHASQNSTPRPRARQERQQERQDTAYTMSGALTEKDDETGDAGSCDFCATDFGDGVRYTCHDCPFNLCGVCIANMRLFYPAHGVDHRYHEKLPGAQAAEPSRHGLPDRQLTCAFCKTDLPGVRYDCQQCPASLCEDDRDLHTAGHALKRVDALPQAPPVTEQDLEEEGYTGSQADDNGVFVEEGYTGSQADDDGVFEVDTRMIPQAPVRKRGRPRNASRKVPVTAQVSNSVEVEDELAGEDSEGEFTDGETRSRDPSEPGSEFGGDLGSANARATKTPRRGRPPRRTQPTQPTQPTHFTLSLPIEGYHVFRTWAEAIIAQDPFASNQSTARSRSRRVAPGRRSAGSSSNARPASSKRGREAGAPRRPWLPQDRQELMTLKRQGLTDEQVSQIVGRSSGAVTQQWRKQSKGLT